MAVSAYSSTNASERAISQFRSELDGGGLRPNLYEVHLDFPDGVAPNLAQAKSDGIFFCKAAALKDGLMSLAQQILVREEQIQQLIRKNFTSINLVEHYLAIQLVEVSSRIQK